MIANNGGENHVNGGGRGGEGGMLQQSQQGNAGVNFNQQQFLSQMGNPNFTENISSQSMVDKNVQGIMNHLSMLQHKIQQLQALVPLISQTAHCQSDINVVIAQQQAASAAVVSIISQLALAASGFLPQQFSSQVVNQVSQPPTELPLSQLLQAAVNPGLNIFQQSGMNSVLPVNQNRNPVLGNSVRPNFNSSGGIPGAVEGGNGGGVAPGNCGLGFPTGGGPAFSGMNNDGEASGQQNASGQHRGGNGSGSNSALRNQVGGAGKNFENLGGGRSRGNGVGSGTSNVIGNSFGASGDPNNFVAPDGGPMNSGLDDHDLDSRADDDDSDGEALPPGSFDLVEMDAMEILAEHTHFCEICGKGFKRDANLRMHMRGHGDEYKTAAALARPDRAAQDTTVIRSRRYSCPHVGCKRNKKHRKFQPLKTMLCVKNHYRRSHCPKVLTCQKCKSKKFSVVADLKTHEKHCGRDKWQCSCGTTFSRKDKLFGHIGLFAGHTPAMPIHEMEGGGNGIDHQGSPLEGAFGSGNSHGGGFLSGSGNVDNFGSNGGSGVDGDNGLGMGLGMGSRGGSGGLTLSDEGGPSLSGNCAFLLSCSFRK